MATTEQLARAPHRFVLCPDCGTIRTRDYKAAKRIKDGEAEAGPMLCLKCRRNPDNWEHGKPVTYVQHKCRCDVCRDWRRVASRSETVSTDIDLTERHGTSTAYVRYKCRCPECKAWKSEYDERYASAYTGECSADGCSNIFESRHSSTLFCTPECGVRQRNKERRIAETTPVLFDPVFAEYQQQRIDIGAYQKYRRPWRWISDRERLAIYEEFNYVCQDCLIRCDYTSVGRGPSIDHVLPWRYYNLGDAMRDHRSNLVVLCRSCNSKKNDRLDSRVWVSLLVRTGDISPTEAYELRREYRTTTPRKESPDGGI